MSVEIVPRGEQVFWRLMQADGAVVKRGVYIVPRSESEHHLRWASLMARLHLITLPISNN